MLLLMLHGQSPSRHHSSAHSHLRIPRLIPRCSLSTLLLLLLRVLLLRMLLLQHGRVGSLFVLAGPRAASTLLLRRLRRSEGSVKVGRTLLLLSIGGEVSQVRSCRSDGRSERQSSSKWRQVEGLLSLLRLREW